MKTNLIGNFLKDRLLFTVGFFLNSFFLILFFYLATGSQVEVFYPLVITVFLFSLILGLEWLRYATFNRNLAKLADNLHYDLKPISKEQKEMAKVLAKIHANYTEKLHALAAKTRERENFLSQWIHNIKTPVSVINLIVQKVAKEEVNQTEVLQNIKEENDRIHTILEQVLNLLRLEDFSKDYVPESVDLLAQVKKVINTKKNQFIYNNVFPKLCLEQIRAEDKELPVLTDAKWNRFLLEQLISNAIKYSEAKGESKCIYFTFSKEGDRTKLTIKDEGIGIPGYDLKRIFEPFFTGENGRKVRDATGIGLYICAVIAEKLGHEIKVKSKVEEGTEITVTYLTKV